MFVLKEWITKEIGSETKCLWLLRTELEPKENAKQKNLEVVIQNQESKSE